MEQFKLNPTGRFSDRVEDYVKYRPRYPKKLLEFLQRDLGLGPGKVVADVGAGTGIFSEMLLESGCRVIGVEPNLEMRSVMEEAFAKESHFQSIDGKSEKTGLADQCVDFITAAQAFHWFEPVLTKKEFQRILKQKGWVVLAWNDRRSVETPFASDYERLIDTFSIDYRKVNHKNVVEPEIRAFLGETDFGRETFYNFQELDLEGLIGRLASSSYAPNVGHPKYAPMVESLTKLFGTYQENGKVRIEYDTKIYFGRML